MTITRLSSLTKLDLYDNVLVSLLSHWNPFEPDYTLFIQQLPLCPPPWDKPFALSSGNIYFQEQICRAAP